MRYIISVLMSPLLLAVAVAGTGVVLAAGSRGPVVTVSGASPYASCTLAGQGSAYVNSEVEPSISVNPTTAGSSHVNLIGVWQQDRWPDGGANGLMAGYSFDGGLTWDKTPLPFDSCAPQGLPYPRASDPWVSVGPDGTAYVVAISFAPGTQISAVTAATSADGGKTWANVQAVTAGGGPGQTAEGFNDKESVTADPYRPGVAYVVWDAAPWSSSGSQPSWFSKTVDGGKTWEKPKIIEQTRTAGTGTIGNEIVVDPKKGVLFDVFNVTLHRKITQRVCKQVKGRTTCRVIKKVDPKHYDNFVAYVQSPNQGATWSAMHIVARAQSVGVHDNAGNWVRTSDSLPAMAVDPRSGKLYVVWQDARFRGNEFDDVVISRSSDLGRHWTSPVVVSSGKAASFTPSIAVSSAGLVGVTYYDLRRNTFQPSTLPTDVWFTRSTDGGAHFGAQVHLGGSFDLRSAPYADGYFLGDYQGLAAVGNVFQPFFIMANTDNTANRTDVFTTTVTP